ncbi:anthrone oxygenase family protein [Actinoplanes sp. L3-i22]|uniref:anthrone oxygenase family protein n=1 Tax=Actinoplanes sp. L3-i22 TaxID=2836373 RepID=UPI001C764E04|nr:anthrone oxygenase family protein [Actinoplanes sp. L3-i22]BCY12142.1 hypothetical protein L3i22_072300 [Actinoplanes sp. L3-i22]
MKALSIAAVVCLGLIAGIFFAFTTSVLPGLHATDDATFVTAMRHLNAAIENGLFLLVFAGALLFPAVLAGLLARAGRPFAWVAAAAGLYLVVLVLTMVVEVPLNDRLADAAVSRADFESVWVPVNDLRTVLSTLALACLGRGMVAGWTR